MYADITPHRVLDAQDPETTTTDNGPLLFGSSPDFNLGPPSLQYIPLALQEMIDEEAKAEGKRRKRS